MRVQTKSMQFCQITSCLVVDEKHASDVTEKLNRFIDSILLEEDIPVYDSEMKTHPVQNVAHAAQIRKESRRF